MKRFAVCVLLAPLLSGCVTQTLVNGVPTTPTKHTPKSSRQAAQARLALAIDYLHAGNTELAKQSLDQAAKDDPNLIDVDLTRGYFYSVVAQPKMAEQAYQRVLKRQPENGDALNNLGVLRCNEHHYQAAEKLFLRALANPNYVAVGSTNENAGLCAYRAHEYDKAKAYFLSALAYNAKRPKSLLGLAKVYIHLHRFDDARTYLARYGDIADNTPQSLLAWIEVARGEGNLAQEVLWGRELINRFPDAPQTKRYLADDY